MRAAGMALLFLLSAGLRDKAFGDARAVWEFDEGTGQTVADSSGNGNNGTLGPTTAVEPNDPTWTTGKYDDAVSFDATNDFVKVPDSASLDITTNVTVEAWVSPAVDTPGFGYIVYKGGMSGATETPLNYGLRTEIAGGQTVLTFRFRASDGKVEFFSGLQGVINTADVWYFVAATYDDATDSVELRVNDSTESFSTTAQMVANDEPLFIGSRPNASLAWDGRIDTTAILADSGPTGVRVAEWGISLVKGSVGLHWKTTAEVDIAGFHIERSPRASGPWQRRNAHMVPARSGGLEGGVYRFQDGPPEREHPFYRLVTVNMDGTEQFSPLVAVHSHASSARFRRETCVVTHSPTCGRAPSEEGVSGTHGARAVGGEEVRRRAYRLRRGAGGARGSMRSDPARHRHAVPRGPAGEACWDFAFS